MCGTKILILVIIMGIVFAYMMQNPQKEGYIDPIYLNRQKYMCDIYPRSNGSIYGLASHVLSGFAYYDSAY